MKEYFRKIFSIDTRILAVFRIFAGFLVIADLLMRARDLSAFYTDAGVLPRFMTAKVFGYSKYFLSFHMWGGSTTFEAILFITAGIFALALIAGYKTRVASIVTWLLLISLHDRNAMILYGGDLLFRNLLFWGMFLPLGTSWSVDAHLKGVKEHVRIFNAFTVGYILQVCCLYWAAAGLKWNADWLEGRSVDIALQINQLTTSWTALLRDQRGITPILTYMVLFGELLGPLLTFVTWRRPMVRVAQVALFALMHICFGIFISLALFPWFSILAWIPFLPAALREENETQIAPQGPHAVSWNTVGAMLTAYVVLLNIQSIQPKLTPTFLGKYWWKPSQILHINQKWNMFSRPLRDDGWFVASTELKNGEKLNLGFGEKELNFNRPDIGSRHYPNDRWRKFMMNLWWTRHKKHRKSYLRYIAHQWNKEHSGLEKIENIKLYYMLDKIQSDGTKREPRRVLIKSFNSPKNQKS